MPISLYFLHMTTIAVRDGNTIRPPTDEEWAEYLRHYNLAIFMGDSLCHEGSTEFVMIRDEDVPLFF